jgi:glycogen debranching enzyme
VKASFTEKFWIPEKGYLKDVLSGTAADEQLRCNQIWALSMTYPMLEEDKERQVLQAVREHLLNECGLRTLSPRDPQYRGHYGGDMFHRDMAYHQGTTWVFPMGAFYRAALRIEKNPGQIRKELEKLIPMMAQGCAGQLPEIYDGDQPYEGKGCFAQAWSVGEILRVLEDLERY